MASSAPDFLCIGAVKSGTTWLYHNLRAHPEVWLPPIKELRYFDRPQTDLAARLLKRDKQRGDDRDYGYWRGRLRHFVRPSRRWLDPAHLAWHLRYFFGRRSPRWYAALFRPAAGRTGGDVTPLYAPLPEERVAFAARHFPDLKIIYLLRDPVERTWAHVLLRCLGLPDVGGEPCRITEALVRRSVRRRDLADDWLFQNGRYAENLRRWERHLSPGQVFIGFHEELKANPPALLRRVQAFLGLRRPALVDASLAHRRFNARPVRMAIPPGIAKVFAERFLEDLRALAERFATPPATGWLERARRRARSSAPSFP